LAVFCKRVFPQHLYKIAAIVAYPVLSAFKKRWTIAGTTAQPCWDCADLVFKSHGSADELAFEQALNRAYDAARNQLLDRVQARIAHALRPCWRGGDGGASPGPGDPDLMRRYSRITGTGSYLPPRRLTNADLVTAELAAGASKLPTTGSSSAPASGRGTLRPDVGSSDLGPRRPQRAGKLPVVRRRTST
jgi:hypothetical protein